MKWDGQVPQDEGKLMFSAARPLRPLSKKPQVKKEPETEVFHIIRRPSEEVKEN